MLFEKSYCLTQLPQLASEVLAFLKPHDWLFLSGDVGMGKTTFCQHLVSVLGGTQRVTSPTFSILQGYPVTQWGFSHVLHLDAYRLRKAEELLLLGFDSLNAPSPLFVWEWMEQVAELAASHSQFWNVFFEQTGVAKPACVWKLSIFPHSNSATMRSYLLEAVHDIFNIC